MITGTFDVCDLLAFVLFDSGASHSFVSNVFASHIEHKAKITLCNLNVSLHDKTTFRCKYMMNECYINVAEEDLKADCILFDLGDDDVILGMYLLLCKNRAIMECHT